MIKLIVGLGNPGSEYEGTRHNLGRATVSALAEHLGARWKRWRQHTVASPQLPVPSPYLFLPATYMNFSGQAIDDFIRFHKLTPEELLVVHDDLDLPLGRIALRQDGGSAGHHGIESVANELGSQDFWRLRVGIDQRSEIRDQRSEATSQYMLSRFLDNEQPLVSRVIDASVRFLVESLSKEPKVFSKTIV